MGIRSADFCSSRPPLDSHSGASSDNNYCAGWGDGKNRLILGMVGLGWYGFKGQNRIPMILPIKMVWVWCKSRNRLLNILEFWSTPWQIDGMRHDGTGGLSFIDLLQLELSLGDWNAWHLCQVADIASLLQQKELGILEITEVSSAMFGVWSCRK